MTGTILIADDDPDARAIVSLGVTDLGYSVIEASDGEEAIKLFQSSTPLMAILDRMMPGQTGSEVCRVIKSSVQGEFIPVLMLTACDTLQDKVSALEGGVDDYLTKPFHLEELQARIKALLRIRDLATRLAEKNKELLAMQERLIKQERQSVVGQLAGTAAHQLGQPLSAILLNCHLLDKLPPGDERAGRAIQAIQQDAKRMSELIAQLRSADASKTQKYHGDELILDLQKKT